MREQATYWEFITGNERRIVNWIHKNKKELNLKWKKRVTETAINKEIYLKSNVK